ncbi:MAG: bifunctional diguanylate cyclase/phosphodiesterase [Acidimicrobiales bacterium]
MRIPGTRGWLALDQYDDEEREHVERDLLGQALQSRNRDIQRMCQLKYVESTDGMSLDVVERHPMWDITSVAVTAIVDWLQTGAGASDPARSRIASLGNAAAIDQETAIVGRSDDRGRPASTDDAAEAAEAVPTGVLSVALVTKLNLWWKDATCLVLMEEAARLGISQRTLVMATDMVTASCNSSMVRMAKQYDAELQDLHARLLHLASHDQLTGLANRAVFLARLETAISRIARHPGGLAVVFIDLDNFKAVNDAYGHGLGDELLTVVAERCTEQMRPEDTIARFGGDEFVALFQDLNDPAAEAHALADRIHRAIAEPIELGGGSVYMTASIGVAVVTGEDCQSDEVLAHADMTMYGVKRAGRNRVALVELGDGPNATVFAMASELRGALERRELTLAYQPVFSSMTGSLVGFEALLRWEHAERGTIAPVEFIPVAEESGLMPAIGAWVLEEACRQSVAWGELLGTDVSMAVNISGRQLADPQLPGLVARVLSAVGLPPRSLILEITESILLGEHADYESTLRQLKDLGIRLSIDDFGTGYSSLAYLRRFPVDQLKVDRGFVQDVAEHGDTRIMGAVVRLAHDLGLDVVAEGVENESERSVVRTLGCDAMQGFLLGRPVPPNSIEESFASGAVSALRQVR